MQRQAGLTAIELIVIVTVFVMLAAVAVPRYAFLTESARVESVRALADDVRAAAERTHRVWESAGGPATLEANGETVELRYGYPTHYSVRSLVVDSSGYRFSEGIWRYQLGDRVLLNCSVTYHPPRFGGETPRIETLVNGC